MQPVLCNKNNVAGTVAAVNAVDYCFHSLLPIELSEASFFDREGMCSTASRMRVSIKLGIYEKKVFQ